MGGLGEGTISRRDVINATEFGNTELSFTEDMKTEELETEKLEMSVWRCAPSQSWRRAEPKPVHSLHGKDLLGLPSLGAAMSLATHRNQEIPLISSSFGG